MESKKPRRFTSTALSLMLLLSVLAVMNFTSMNVRADWLTDEDWVIENEHVWNESETITLDHCNLTVKNGGILTFNNSVTLKIISDNPGDYGITIEDGGKFEINSSSANTEIISDSYAPWNTYWFLNSGTIDFLGATVERVWGDTNYLDEPAGIMNMEGSNCKMNNCNIIGSDTHGIYAEGNVKLSVENTTITNATYKDLYGNGIWIDDGSDILIDNVQVSNTKEDSIKLTNTNNVTIQGGTVINNSQAHGIHLDYSSNVMIRGHIEVQNCQEGGIYLSNSDVVIEGVFIHDNAWSGIYMDQDSSSYIANSTITGNNQMGIEGYENDFVNSYNNRISGNDYGICLTGTNISLTGNEVTGNTQAGIYLESAYNNTITNNNVSNNVKSPPTNSSKGIHLYSSNGNTIANNLISSNDNCGIYLSLSSDTTIVNNTALNNCVGIELDGGNNNTIIGNIALDNSYGLFIDSCSSCTISNNTVSYNENYGITLVTTPNTMIYHNNFINNTIQAHDNGTNNSWDNGYPSGGNYWSDYNGTDTQYGENQNYSGPDGIGDTSYTNQTGQGIGGGSSEDKYPLMGPIIDGRFMKPAFRIDSDQDFVTKSWIAPTGNGSAENPWIIKNYYINGTGEGYCIYIANTTDYFIVENCELALADGMGADIIYPNAGLILYNLEDGVVRNNTVSTNEYYGIYLSSADYNVVDNNLVMAHDWVGIFLDFSNYNEITNNNVSSNTEVGIALTDSDVNYFAGNIVYSNTGLGIWMQESDMNQFTNNNITANGDYGIYLEASSNCNEIWHNNFYGNNGGGVQAYDDANNNYWNNATMGNYWDDYSGSDSNSDGIGDTPYALDGDGYAYDNKPLMYPIED